MASSRATIGGTANQRIGSDRFLSEGGTLHSLNSGGSCGRGGGGRRRRSWCCHCRQGGRSCSCWSSTGFARPNSCWATSTPFCGRRGTRHASGCSCGCGGCSSATRSGWSRFGGSTPCSCGPSATCCGSTPSCARGGSRRSSSGHCSRSWRPRSSGRTRSGGWGGRGSSSPRTCCTSRGRSPGSSHSRRSRGS